MRDNLTTNPPFPWVELKKRLTEEAYITRSQVPNFLFDDPEFEASLGRVENRPAHINEDGSVYLGQWRFGPKSLQIKEGRGTLLFKAGDLYEGYWKDD